MAAGRSLPSARRPGPPARGAGFTLVEVLVAVVLLGLVLPVVVSGAGHAVAARSVLSEDTQTAAVLAREIHDLARTLDRRPSGTGGARRGADVVAIDSLVGARFSPPLRSDRSADATRSEWAQRVDVTVYALDDLQTPTGETLGQGLRRHADRLLRLEVTIERRGDVVDSLAWWVTP